jgi:hypothetical protein
MRLRSANPAAAKGPSPAPKNRFERYPRLALLIMVLVLLTIMLGAVEWSLTLASDRLNPQPKADIQTGTGNPPQARNT